MIHAIDTDDDIAAQDEVDVLARGMEVVRPRRASRSNPVHVEVDPGGTDVAVDDALDPAAPIAQLGGSSIAGPHDGGSLVCHCSFTLTLLFWVWLYSSSIEYSVPVPLSF
jgi:hypothetical protein